MTGAETIADLSRWVDDANTHRDREALLWHRVAKVGEEAGEAVSALIGATGGNPRKGVVGSMDDVVEELLDAALAALCAVEHLTGNRARSLTLLEDKISRVAARAGVS